MYRKHKDSSNKSIKYFSALVSLVKFNRTRGEESIRHIREAMLCLDGGASQSAHDIFIEQGGYLYLPQVLSNTEYLESLPPDSLGAHYLRHITDGVDDKVSRLSSIVHANPESSIEHFMARQADVHDLMHVLLGYGKERLGEACVVSAYSNYYKGWRLIVVGGLLLNVFRRRLFIPSRIRYLWRAVYTEPRLRAASIECWDLIHWERYLAHPIEDVRRRFGVYPSEHYSLVRKKYLSEGGI